MKKNKTQKIAISFSAILLLVSISGCDKKVDYNVETPQNAKGTIQSVETFDENRIFTDSYSVSTENGDASITIDAHVFLPDCENMSVIEIEKIPLTTELKKKVIKQFLGDAELYYHDNVHLQKKEVERKMYEAAGLINIGNEYPDDPYMVKQTDEVIEEYAELEACLPNAKDEWTKATEIDSCNEFVAKRDDIVFELNFKTDSDGYLKEINGRPLFQESYDEEQDFTVVEQYYGAPSLRDYEGRSSNNEGYPSKNESIFGENESKFSFEESQKLVDDFINKMGITYQEKCGECDYEWYAFKDDIYEVESIIRWGYKFSYGFGMEDIVFSDHLNFEEVVYLQDGSIWPDDYFEQPKSCITVTDYGISEFTITAPVNVVKTSEKVELLPVDSIYKVMKDELQNNPDKYNLKGSVTFKSLTLGYIRIKDSSDSTKYSYVPTWCLKACENNFDYYLVYVNAIDGTVIDPGNDL